MPKYPTKYRISVSPKPQSRNGKLLEMDCPTRFRFASYPNHFFVSKGETILLIESAIKPLHSSGNDDPHLKDVLRALQLRCLPLAFLSYSQPSHFALLRLAYQHGQCQDRLGEGGHGHDHLAASYVMVHSRTTFLHGPLFTAVALLLLSPLSFSTLGEQVSIKHRSDRAQGPSGEAQDPLPDPFACHHHQPTEQEQGTALSFSTTLHSARSCAYSCRLALL